MSKIAKDGEGQRRRTDPQRRRRMYYMTNLFTLKKPLKGNYGYKEDRTKAKLMKYSKCVKINYHEEKV